MLQLYIALVCFLRPLYFFRPFHTHIRMRPYPSFSYASPSHSATYLELGDGQVMETLQKHLTQWKSQKERDGGGGREETTGTNVVLFRGAIEHVTRLCRVMVGKTIRQVCPPPTSQILSQTASY